MNASVETSNWPLPANGLRFIVPPRLRRVLARHPLSAGCYPLALGFYPEAAGHRMQRPLPDDHLLIYCRAGRGWLDCGNASTSALTARPQPNPMTAFGDSSRSNSCAP